MKIIASGAIILLAAILFLNTTDVMANRVHNPFPVNVTDSIKKKHSKPNQTGNWKAAKRMDTTKNLAIKSTTGRSGKLVPTKIDSLKKPPKVAVRPNR